MEIPSSPFTLFTPTFKGVGRQLDITDLAIVDEFGEPLETVGSVMIEMMDGTTGGFTGDIYTHSYGLYENTNWAKNDEEIERGVTPLASGVAFSVSNGMGEKCYFRVSGEVDLVCKNEISAEPFSLWGNASPVSIDLTSIRPVDVDGEPVETVGSLMIQPINKETGGVTEDIYTHSYGLYENTGWAVNDEELEAGKIFLAPGEAFFISNGFGDTLYFQLPSPLKN